MSIPGTSLGARLRGHGAIGLLAVAVVLLGNSLFVPLSALLVLAWARLTQTPLAALGLARARAPWRALLLGAVLGVTTKLMFKAVVMPTLGAPAVNAAYGHLLGNTAALPGMVVLILVGAGFGEEVVFRGFLIERLRGWLPAGRAGTVASVLLSALVFGAAHLYDQGVPGFEQALLFGAFLGWVYVREGTLWLPMVTHVAFDLTALYLIYGGLETQVSHWLLG